MPLRLTYENRTVLEIFRWLEIDGRGGDGSAEAVVVSTHDYGTAGARTSISSRSVRARRRAWSRWWSTAIPAGASSG